MSLEFNLSIFYEKVNKVVYYFYYNVNVIGYFYYCFIINDCYG
jgi:hypothetical protein